MTDPVLPGHCIVVQVLDDGTHELEAANVCPSIEQANALANKQAHSRLGNFVIYRAMRIVRGVVEHRVESSEL